MSDLSKHSGGFVSNPSDRTIRNSARNAQNRVHVAESVCSSERGESQLEKLNRSSGPSEGQLNNRKLHEPPLSALALRQTQNNFMCHAARPHLRSEGTGDYFGEESIMRLSYSGLNGSGYDLNSRIHGCPAEEHFLVG